MRRGRVRDGIVRPGATTCSWLIHAPSGGRGRAAVGRPSAGPNHAQPLAPGGRIRAGIVRPAANVSRAPFRAQGAATRPPSSSVEAVISSGDAPPAHPTLSRPMSLPTAVAASGHGPPRARAYNRAPTRSPRPGSGNPASEHHRRGRDSRRRRIPGAHLSRPAGPRSRSRPTHPRRGTRPYEQHRSGRGGSQNRLRRRDRPNRRRGSLRRPRGPPGPHMKTWFDPTHSQPTPDRIRSAIKRQMPF